MKNLLAAFSLLALAASADAEVRTVGAFTGIDVAGTMMVTAKIGPAKVEVVGDADLVKLVSTTVKNGVLVIDTPRDLAKKDRKDAKLEVVVSTPSLSGVTISGTGVVRVDGLGAKSFAASISGTGALQLAGKTEKLAVVVAGTGEVKAKGLVAADVEIDVLGTAEAQVHAAKSLDADVKGTALVTVYGKPASVKKHTAGTAVIDIK